MAYPIYCEQPIQSGVFEPVNTLTNLFFITAGIYLFLKLNRRKILDRKGIWFSALLVLIGIGSFAWHFKRTDFNLMADSIPIGLFVLSYLYFYLTRTAGKLRTVLLLFLGFFLYTPLVIGIVNNLAFTSFFNNGGLSYTVALSYFLILQVHTFFFKPVLLKGSLFIILLFFCSIIFRQIDLTLCPTIVIGTHFLWHILNAIVLYSFVWLLYHRAGKFNH